MIIANRYKIIDLMSSGGMGVVYRATDRLTHDTVVLKQMHLPSDDALHAFQNTVANSKTAIFNEFRILAGLRHPHIISVFDYGMNNGHPFIVMELLEDAQPFNKAVAQLAPIDQIKKVIQILEALEYLHRHGVIHRDLKPTNVLVIDGQVKILDFGLSVAATMAKGRVGTIGYMAPETLATMTTVPQSDLYAVGMMIYEMIAGYLPFKPDEIMSIIHEAPDMSPLADHPAAYVIKRLLRKDPHERFASASVTIQAFATAINLPLTEDASVRESFLQASVFVGREQELKTLGDELTQTIDGTTSFYLIGGESGIGKSRLLDEVRIQAIGQGFIVLRGRAVEDSGLSFQLWRDVVRHLLLMVTVDDVQASILKEISPDIDELLGRKITIAEPLTDGSQQARLHLAIIDLFKRSPKPILLLLEDLQWERESIEPFKQLLVGREQLSHLMVIGTYRSDEYAALPHDLPATTVVHLARLQEADIRNLSQAMLGPAGSNPYLVDLLRKETEGNLFFLVETIRALAEEAGSLAKVGVTTLPETVFSGGVQAVLQRRLQQIAPHLRPIQSLAAVIGREFDLNLLRHHFPNTRIEEWLISAANVAVLDIEANRWFFSHDKMRVAVLESLSESEFKQMHRQAAEAYLHVYGTDAAYAGLLVGHWHNAGDKEQTFHYAHIAAQYNFTRGLLPTALTFAEQALAFAGVAPDAEKVIALRLLSGEIHIRMGHYQEALEIYEIVLEASIKRHDPKHQAEALTRISWIHLRRSNINTAQEFGLAALALAEESADPSVLIRVHKNLGMIAMNAGDFDEADEHIKHSLHYAQQLEMTSEVGTLYNALGLVYLIQGYHNQASQYFEASFDYFNQLDDRWNMAVALHNQGGCLINLGHYKQAEQKFQHSLDLDRSINDKIGIAYHLSYLMHIALNREAYAEATAYLNEIETISQDMMDRKVQALMARAAGWMYLYQSDFNQSRQYFTQAQQINTELGHQPSIIVAEIAFGWIALLQNNWRVAHDIFGQNIERAAQLGDHWTTAEIHNGLALALHHLGETAIADEHIKQSIALSHPKASTPLLLEALAVYAALVMNTTPDDAVIVGYFVYNHPAARTLARKLVKPTLTKLKTTRDAGGLDVAIQRSTQQDLETLIKKLR